MSSLEEHRRRRDIALNMLHRLDTKQGAIQLPLSAGIRLKMKGICSVISIDNISGQPIY